MKNRVLLAALVLTAAACSGKKKTENKEPPVEQPVANSGSGSAKSGSAEAPKPDPKLVARGEYLSHLLGCGSCHIPLGPAGPDVTRPFAGGAEIPESFGTWRSPNITQDKETGIGT